MGKVPMQGCADHGYLVPEKQEGPQGGAAKPVLGGTSDELWGLFHAVLFKPVHPERGGADEWIR